MRSGGPATSTVRPISFLNHLVRTETDGGDAMTKADLIEALANKLDINRGDAEKAVNIVLDDIVNALHQGERVNISGFGTFSVSTRQARTGRNPKTGASIEIAASRSAKFKPGKQLKDSLNEGMATTPSASSSSA